MDKNKLLAVSAVLNVILIRQLSRQMKHFTHDFAHMAKLLGERDAIIEQARDIVTADLFEDIVEHYDE